MTEKQYDLIIIGGGPGGYIAAIRAGQLGLKTLVVEKDKLGGICLNWGCIPTKALLKNAEIYNLLKHSNDFGFTFDNLKVDFTKAVQRSRDISSKSAKGIEYLFKKNKIEYINGTAKIIEKNIVEVTQPGKVNNYSAKNIIIATGARSRELPNLKIDNQKIITSSEAMVLKSVPEKMLIVGAGAIGVEFAYFYNAYGTKVTIIEMKPNILPIEDVEVSKTLTRCFQKSGIEILTETTVNSTEVGNGVKVKLSTKNGEKEIDVDVVLVAVGVQGNIENLGLENIGIVTEKSHIKVNEYYQTNIETIFAIGDVIGAPWLAHVASMEGIVCVEKIAGKNPHKINYNNIPGCTYCQPQIASVGLTEEKAREQGLDIKVGRFPFRSHGKALAINEPEGFVKLIIDANYGEILGAHIVSTEATEMIAEIVTARNLEATAEQLYNSIHAHPTLSEGIAEAALDAYGQGLNI
ncbi:MAG: dihydrolipoyl dehydrogenase [Bacteroidetes bacterium]|nr:dihydrolipoyl dehydrogenase [Bacteroidota bacterium]